MKSDRATENHQSLIWWLFAKPLSEVGESGEIECVLQVWT